MKKEEFIKLTIFHGIVSFCLFKSTKDLWFGITSRHKTGKDIIDAVKYEREHNNGELWYHIETVNYTDAEIEKAEIMECLFYGY